MRLWIAEKPSVARDLAYALGNGKPIQQKGFFQCGEDYFSFCVGHLLEQAEAEAYDPKYVDWDFKHLPIIPTPFKLVPLPKTKEQLAVLGALLRKANKVMHCGDAGREGQLIVDEVLKYFNYRGEVDRMWMQAMNPPALKKAFSAAKPNSAYRSLGDAAVARSEADFIVGINLTRAYTCAHQHMGGRGVMHMGRVQTVVLSLIAQRVMDIQNFVPEPYYDLKCTLLAGETQFEAKWEAPKDSPLLNAQGRIGNMEGLREIARKITGQTAQVTSVKKELQRKQPWLPYSLGDLQKDVSKVLGLTAKQTLTIAQALYEKHKLTTYPRTDYNHLPENEFPMGESFVEAAKSNFDSWPWAWFTPDYSLRSPAWNDGKIGDHHGLRPTDRRGYDLSQLTSHERVVYEMILERFLMQFAPPYQYESTVATFAVEGETLKATGKVEVDIGWRKFIEKRISSKAKKTKDSDEQEEDPEVKLPPLKQGDSCKVHKANVGVLKTTAPPYFDVPGLVGAMEQAHLYVTNERIRQLLKEVGTGIGTSATRGDIIAKLEKTEYIVLEKEGRKKVYKPTEKGWALFHETPPVLKTPDLTAYFEEMLKQVEAGKIPGKQFMDTQIDLVKRILQTVDQKYFQPRQQKENVQ